MTAIPEGPARRLARIASALESARRPSRDKLAGEIGKVLLALDPLDLTAPAETQFSGGPEGSTSVPVGQLISVMNGWLSMKYQKDAAYRSYADRVRGPWRDALVAHWQEHAGDERGHAYDIAMKIVGLGGDPIQTSVSIPASVPNLSALGLSLMNLELQAIERGRQVAEMAGSMDALRVLAEEVILKDAHHLDDLRRMFVELGG